MIEYETSYYITIYKMPANGEPAIEIKTDEQGENPVALNGVRPLERGQWRIAEGAQEIRGEAVEEIVLLARQLVEKVGKLRDSAGMGRVDIRPDSKGGPSLRIESQWPIESDS